MKIKVLMSVVLFSCIIFIPNVFACSHQPGCYDNCTKLFPDFWQQWLCMMGKTRQATPSQEDTINQPSPDENPALKFPRAQGK